MIKHTYHGLSGTVEYNIWQGIKSRCYDRNTKWYKNYGARGIKMCPRWFHSFLAFLADMGPRPSSKHSVERRNNDGDYEPDNCHWATEYVQHRNNRRNQYFEYDGKRMILPDWARESGIPYWVLYMRIRNGWDFQKAITKTPIKKPGSGPRKKPK